MSDFAEAIAHLRRSDKILKKLIRKVGPCLMESKNHRSPFEALVRSVTYQQLNGTAAATIFRRFKELYPGRRFPRPKDVLETSDARMRSAGLSRAKIAAIKDLAANALSGVVPTSKAISKLSDAEIVERL